MAGRSGIAYDEDVTACWGAVCDMGSRISRGRGRDADRAGRYELRRVCDDEVGGQPDDVVSIERQRAEAYGAAAV